MIWIERGNNFKNYNVVPIIDIRSFIYLIHIIQIKYIFFY